MESESRTAQGPVPRAKKKKAMSEASSPAAISSNSSVTVSTAPSSSTEPQRSNKRARGNSLDSAAQVPVPGSKAEDSDTATADATSAPKGQQLSRKAQRRKQKAANGKATRAFERFNQPQKPQPTATTDRQSLKKSYADWVGSKHVSIPVDWCGVSDCCAAHSLGRCSQEMPRCNSKPSTLARVIPTSRLRYHQNLAICQRSLLIFFSFCVAGVGVECPRVTAVGTCRSCGTKVDLPKGNGPLLLWLAATSLIAYLRIDLSLIVWCWWWLMV